MNSSSPNRRRTVSILAAVTVALALVTAVTQGGSGPHPNRASGRFGAVATVVERSLSAQLALSGTVEYVARPDGSPYTVVNHAAGMLTAVPSAGQVVRQGQVLYRVADQPVILLNGQIPAYRTLSEGDVGPDVRQLNADLVALGYATPGQLDPRSDSFGAWTAIALERLQVHLGLAPTGALQLGRAVFLPGPLRITRVLGTVGIDVAAHSTASTEFVSLAVTPPRTAPHRPRLRCSRVRSRPITGGRGPERHICRPHRRHRRHPHHPPGSVGSHPGHPRPRGQPGASAAPSGSGGRGAGGPSGPGGGQPQAQPILQASSTRQDVVANLDTNDLSSVRIGDPALVTLPDGRTTPGVVSAIGTVAASGGGSGSSASTVPIHVALEEPGVATGLDQATVQVQITTATVHGTLAVPVIALAALPSGQFALRVLDEQHGVRLVRVAVGLFDDTDGLVRVTSPTLTAGQRVLLPGSPPT